MKMSTTCVRKSHSQLSSRLYAKEKRKAVAGGKAKLWNIPRGWAHQGFFYLDRTQRTARIVFELVPTAFFSLLISRIFEISLSNIWLWAGSLFATHTLNWIFNCNWWAGILFTFPGLRNPGEKTTCDYLNSMADRLRNISAVSGVMIFGSVSRRQWHERSDLDIRLLRRKGFVNGIIAAAVLFREKVIALFCRQPLDIYLADDIRFLKKMRADETPVFLKKNDPRLDKHYPESTEVRINTLSI